VQDSYAQHVGLLLYRLPLLPSEAPLNARSFQRPQDAAPDTLPGPSRPRGLAFEFDIFASNCMAQRHEFVSLSQDLINDLQ
jgi:hypothetical protein